MLSERSRNKSEYKRKATIATIAMAPITVDSRFIMAKGVSWTMTLREAAEFQCDQLLITGVPVEKLFHAKIAKTKLRKDAISDLLEFKAFCIPQISSVFDESGLFQQPQALTLKIPPGQPF